MASSGEEDLIAQFQDVTGANPERAKFYMEASGWDLNAAIAGFFEGDQSDEGEQMQNDLSSNNVKPRVVDTVASNTDAPPPARTTNLPATVTKPVARGGLATLDSLRQQEDDSSDEDERGQAFFAGGSLTSGQQVLGPPGKKKDEFIKELFEKAKEHGATAEDPFAPAKTASSFGGTGFKLGDSVGGSTSVASNAQRSTNLEPCEVTLRLWRTGFTVNDGELRLYSDPENLAFLDAIKSGEIPRELVRSHPGQEVQLAMEDRRHEQYEPPRQSLNPFSGQGHMLGSPTPNVVASAVQTSAADHSANEQLARNQINLSESEPVTNLQFRLADGTRLVARFNHTHRVGDLHTFINTARPQYRSTNYVLTLFPNRDLTDMEVSIKDANILSAALTQKMKSSA